MDRSRVAIVIPAHNEAESIFSVVRGAVEHGAVIVVNDGSTDETAERAHRAGANVVSHSHAKGYDAALERGFREADRLQYEIVLTMDADGQHRPEFIPMVVGEVEADAQISVGIRDRKQRISEHAFALLTRLLFGIEDPLSGMKAYRMEIYRSLGHFDSYRSIGTELLLFAACSGRKVAQVAIQTSERAGTPRFGSRLRANARIFAAMYGFARRAMFGFGPAKR